jgi:N-acetylmuramic acid 6-phosphate etherase
MEKKISSLSTEKRNPNTVNIDTVDTVTMVKMLNDENKNIADAVGNKAAEIARAVDCITESMKNGGRLFYIGAGTSGRLGILDASECKPTFSLPTGRIVGIIAGGDHAIKEPVENIEDDPNASVLQLKSYNVSEKDVVCGIAASGRTPYVIGGLKYANSIGAKTICVTNNAESEMRKVSDIAIDVPVGPEPLTGSTRLKSGTAQKLVINILSTATMIRQGKTYSNLMVDVAASNEKLRKRCVNILAMILPDKGEEEIVSALNKSGGKVKLSAVILKTGKSPYECEGILEANGGFLRKILG